MYSRTKDMNLANLNRQAVSVGEQSLDCGHSGGKAMVAIFCIDYQHPHSGGRVCHLTLGLRLGSSRSHTHDNNTHSLRSSHTQLPDETPVCQGEHALYLGNLGPLE